MRKITIISAFSLAVAGLLSFGMIQEAKADLTFQQDAVPDACESELRRGKECKRWYELGRPKPIVLHGIHFDTDSARIKSSSARILDENAAQLKARNTHIRIEGHTDSDGSVDHNQKLSEARANAVMNYFTAKGVKSRDMRAVGRGESVPVASNSSPEGKAMNRRIELHFDR